MRNSRLELLLTRILKNQVVEMKTRMRSGNITSGHARDLSDACDASDDLVHELKDTMRLTRGTGGAHHA
jgi:hypothetical protein